MRHYFSTLIGITLIAYSTITYAKVNINIILENPPSPSSTTTYLIPNDEETILFRENTQHRHYFWRLPQNKETFRHAVIGGYENNTPLYICQAFYNNGIHPGKVVAGRCNIGWGGNEMVLDHFRVLFGDQLEWRSSRNRITLNAVQGGFAEGQPLYVCHAHYANGVHPGKIVAGACNISYGGQEIRLLNYQILVSPRE